MGCILLGVIATLFITSCCSSMPHGERVMGAGEVDAVREALHERLSNDPRLVDVIKPAVGVEYAAPIVPVLVDLLDREPVLENRIHWRRIAILMAEIAGPARGALPSLRRCRDYRISHPEESDTATGNNDEQIAQLEVAIHCIEVGAYDASYARRAIQEANLRFAIRSIGKLASGDKDVRRIGFEMLNSLGRYRESELLQSQSADLLEALVAALDDREQYNQETTAGFIISMGSGARSALPAIKARLRRLVLPQEETLGGLLDEAISRIER